MVTRIDWHIIKILEPGVYNLELLLEEAHAAFPKFKTIDRKTNGSIWFRFTPPSSTTQEQVNALMAAHDPYAKTAEQSAAELKATQQEAALTNLRALGVGGIRALEDPVLIASALADICELLDLG